MTLEIISFVVFALLAIASALLVITAKHPVVSAMSMIFHFFMLAGLYLTLSAQFIAVMQVMVYAGAIMVLVVFAIMLLNLGDESKLRGGFNFRKLIAWFLGGALAVQIAVLLSNGALSNTAISEKASELGTAQVIGGELFTNYIYPIEIVGILLFAAIVGAIYMAKKNLPTEE